MTTKAEKDAVRNRRALHDAIAPLLPGWSLSFDVPAGTLYTVRASPMTWTVWFTVGGMHAHAVQLVCAALMSTDVEGFCTVVPTKTNGVLSVEIVAGAPCGTREPELPEWLS